MPYRDAWVICEECGTKFVFTVERQRQLANAGADVQPPQVCSNCGEHVEPTEGPQEGTVKWYDPEKRYGFIVQRTGQEIFFHRSGFAPGSPDRFLDGARVTYLLEQTDKGYQAVEVAPMDDEETEF